MSDIVNTLMSMFVILLFGFVPFVYLYEVMSRKLIADLQARVGPKESGLGGFLQPIHDLFRLLQKEPGELSWQQSVAYIVMIVSAFSLFSAVPINPIWMTFNEDASFLIPLCGGLGVAASIYWLVLLERDYLATTTLLRWLSVLGAASVTILISISAISLEIGGLSWEKIIEAQQGGLSSWNVFRRPPIFLVVFACYFISGLTFFDLEPMRSLSVSGARGQTGLGTVFIGRYSLLFGLAKRIFIFSWVCIGVCLFLGGWHPPVFSQIFLVTPIEATPVIVFLQFLILFSKALGVLLLLTWFSSTLSKLRAEQVGELQWKVFTPLALFSFVGLAVWIFLELGSRG